MDMKIAKCKGATAVEYVFGLGLIVIVLLVPIQNGKNTLELLSDAVKQEHTAYVNAAALPPLPSQ